MRKDKYSSFLQTYNVLLALATHYITIWREVNDNEYHLVKFEFTSLDG
jgi:hypothetical protein